MFDNIEASMISLYCMIQTWLPYTYSFATVLSGAYFFFMMRSVVINVK
jgi:hypothetical protein